MSKIIYLIEQPLDDRNYDRFGIQTWIDRGWKVEVWDLTPLSHPRVWQKCLELGEQLCKFECYFPIASKWQLKQRFSGQKIEYFIDFVGDSYSSIRVKMRLARLGATRVICSTGSIPTPGDRQESGFLHRVKKVVTAGPVKSLKLLTNAFMYKLAAPYMVPGITIVSGENSISPSVARDDEIVRAHNFDYDIYLRINNSVDPSPGGFAVFIDQDFCFHPEFAYQGISNGITPEKYFRSICKGLNKISQTLAVDLRVAAHPRSAYQQRIPDYFEGIEIQYGKTAELIRDCKVVVCHDSTAIQFAVLFGKPVIFITTDEIDSLFFDFSFRGESIARFASALGKSVINVDRDLDSVNWRCELLINSGKYNEYRNRYIKTVDSPELPFWDIVIDHIERIHERSYVDPSEQCVRPSSAQ